MKLGAFGSLALGSLVALGLGATAAFAAPVMSEDFSSFDADIPGLEDSEIGLIGERGPCWFASSGSSRAGRHALCSSGTADVGFEGDLYDSFSFDLGGLAGGFRLDLSLAAWETGILDGPSDPADLLDFIDILVDDTEIARFQGAHDTMELARAIGDVDGPATIGRQFFRDFSFFVGDAVADLFNTLTFKVRLTGGNEYVAFDSIAVTALGAEGNTTPIPAPASGLLFGAGLVGLGLLRTRRRPQ